ALAHGKSAQEVAQYCATSCALGCRPCTTVLSEVFSVGFVNQVRNFLRTMATRHHLVEAAA
ncbi:hypothetical protein, partial [Pseudomonas sp. IT-P395]|uniref:hypothetical protein n=1 Tax=Pseudomonas sp. IT-P395 TaxID=3026459 RepID=UPI0039E1BA7F